MQWPFGFLEYIALVNLLFQMFVFLLKSFDRLVESFPLDFAICADWNCWEGDFRHWMRRRLDWHENRRLLPLTPKAGDKVGSKKHPDASNDCPQNSKTTIQFWTCAICFDLCFLDRWTFNHTDTCYENLTFLPCNGCTPQWIWSHEVKWDPKKTWWFQQCQIAHFPS